MTGIMKLDGAQELDFDRESVEQAYDRWAPIYDLVFGGVFSKGRDAAIQATNKIGGRVPACASYVARDLPQLCARTVLGEQRQAVHRQSCDFATQPVAATVACGCG